MFKKLNSILHSELRLAIISLLSQVDTATFGFLKEKTEASSGNLSVQIKKLEKAEYIVVKKSFKDNYPLTTCAITKKGTEAFEEYVEALKGYIE